jgi:anthraniloyl-CoA monooxygenase
VRVAVIGGGPAGLYFSLLLKQARPDADITVLERNRPDDTFGWGVVFSDQTLENFRAADRPTFDRITSSFAHWDDIDVHSPRSGDYLERPRLRRHCPQEAAQHSADPLR